MKNQNIKKDCLSCSNSFVIVIDEKKDITKLFCVEKKEIVEDTYTCKDWN